MNGGWWRVVIGAALAVLAGCTPLRRGPLPPLTTPPPAKTTAPVPDADGGRTDRPDPTPPDGSLPVRDQVCALARSYLGTPYVYGGASPDGFDCSGLVFHVYREVGVSLPRTAGAQASAGRHVNRTSLLPGDLVFFRTRGTRISHVGIYVGEGRFVHAPSSGKTVRVDSLDDPWWLRRYAGARRVLAASSSGLAASVLP